MNYTLENDRLKIEASDLGGQLMSLKSKASGKEFLWQGHPGFWADRAPNLFPYIGRLSGGKYTYQGRSYSLNVHGFFRSFPRMEVKNTATELVFEYESNEETLKAYPFQFVFQVRFSLEGNALHIVYQVENRNDKPMYFGVGGHPAFNVPLDPATTFEDYYVAFEEGRKPKQMTFSENFLIGGEEPYTALVGNKIPLDHSLFDNDAIVLKDAGAFAEIGTEKLSARIRVDFPDMPYVGIWHRPKTQAHFVCIEPWSSLPSREGVVEDLESQPDLVALEAGGIYKNVWTTTITD